MLWAIASFELRRRLRQPSSYAYLAFFAGMAALYMVILSEGRSSDHTLANSPVALQVLIPIVTLFGVHVSSAVFGRAVSQDAEHRCEPFFFTSPVGKASYLLGRFLGAFLFVAALFAPIGLSMWAVTILPRWVQPESFGPNRLDAYLWPYLNAVIPNLLATGALFFALGTLTRKMRPVYGAATLLLVLYFVGAALSGGQGEYLTLGALLDPFGIVATDSLYERWTVAERNSQLVPFTGLLLANRALWLGIAAALLGATVARFRMGAATEAGGRRAEPGPEATPAPVSDSDPSGAPALAGPLSHGSTYPLARLTWLSLRGVLRSTSFSVVATGLAFYALMMMYLTDRFQGTPIYPVTHRVLTSALGNMGVVMLALTTFFAGELSWSERDARLDQILDASPLATWVPYLAKLLALLLVQALALGATVLVAFLYQRAMGFPHHEPGLALTLAFGVYGPSFACVAVLAMATQAALNNRYAGHAAMAAYFLFVSFGDKLGLRHGLFRYGRLPDLRYSDMNGFGHFARPLAWYGLHWTGWALALAVAGALLWPRGNETAWRTRLGLARGRLSRGSAALAGAGLLLALGSGAVILYNTRILNHAPPSPEAEEERQVQYEQRYKALEGAPQPKVVEVHADFDLHPESASLEAHGRYVLENQSGQPIPAVYVQLPHGQAYQRLSVGEVTQPSQADPEQGFYTFQLPSPLAPGARVELGYALHYGDVGFKDEGNRTDLVENGTFFSSHQLPHLGYDRDLELAQERPRKARGLPARPALLDPHDPQGLQRSPLGGDGDRVRFESTVSTAADQIALLPGEPDHTWTEGDRRFAHFAPEAPLFGTFALVSGRYAVRRDTWQGVELAVYHHPAHDYDVDEMLQGMKDALAYCTEHFGPYPYKQLRIVEVPRYAPIAMSFPNTIPFSETLGFIARVDPNRPDQGDYPYFVTAHEVAHQWWGHLASPAKVQGAPMLTESLAEYTALMVLKKRFGPKALQTMLRYELRTYLRARGYEGTREQPLSRVEHQDFVYYNKGGLALTALQEAMGEGAVDQVLAAYLARHRMQGPPYPSTDELIDELKRAATPDQQRLIHDLLETVTLYDNRARSASARALPKGKYEVTVKVAVRKVQAEEQGAEREVPADDLLEIGAVDDDGKPVAVEQRRLQAGESEQTLVVNRLPARAGIDPLGKLIDRNADDNLAPVSRP